METATATTKVLSKKPKIKLDLKTASMQQVEEKNLLLKFG